MFLKFGGFMPPIQDSSDFPPKKESRLINIEDLDIFPDKLRATDVRQVEKRPAKCQKT